MESQNHDHSSAAHFECFIEKKNCLNVDLNNQSKPEAKRNESK